MSHGGKSPFRNERNTSLRLMDAIDDHDDVQNVFSNFDIADEILAAYEG